MIPVSAQDFSRRKRRIVLACIAGALLVGSAAAWGYRRSVQPLEAQQSLDEGRRLLKSTRYQEAILAFDHAVALKNDLPEAYLLRGRANIAINRPDQAIRDFATVIGLQPGDAAAYMERAMARLTVEDYAGTIADCTAALSRDPKLILAYNLRGIALRNSVGPQQALTDFDRAVELDPGEANYFQRAATYQNLSDHKRAIADLDQVIALSPDSPMGYLARAKSREALGDAVGASTDREKGRILEGREKGR